MHRPSNITPSNMRSVAVVLIIFIIQGFANQVNEVRPPYTNHAARARYMVHMADWAMLGTISTQSAYQGRPFLNPISICDGTLDNSTGVPYMYASPLDVSMQDVTENNQITLSLSEAELNIDDCHLTKHSDPENPLCSRLVMFGTMEQVSDATELEFVKKAMFSRHPIMASWPEDHKFTFMKMQLTDLWMIDFFGGGVTIDIKDYFKAKP
ncbi:protein CREG1-like isoform X1 [Anneissia japonica]|uniref:protein CREG1-like isoform X1 n=1 Tax=Anneissia japonica TaxID=1529436 RepID=UPI001425916D|nr:protein CREG1-like isoform X1 [Anneissia japonica]